MKNNSNRLFGPRFINISTGESGILADGGLGAVPAVIRSAPWMSGSETNSMGTPKPGLDDEKTKMRTTKLHTPALSPMPQKVSACSIIIQR